MINFRQVLEGWRNGIVPKKELKEKIKAVHEERMAICRACEHNSINATKAGKYSSMRPDEHCTICGCTLYFKTMCLSCSCPIDKWKAEVSQEEDQKEIRPVVNTPDNEN